MAEMTDAQIDAAAERAGLRGAMNRVRPPRGMTGGSAG